MSIFSKEKSSEPSQEEIQQYAESSEAYERELHQGEEEEEKAKVEALDEAAKKEAREAYQKATYTPPTPKEILQRGVRGLKSGLKTLKEGKQRTPEEIAKRKERKDKVMSGLRKFARGASAMGNNAFSPQGKSSNIFGTSDIGKRGQGGDLVKPTQDRSPFDTGDTGGRFMKPTRNRSNFDAGNLGKDLIGTSRKKSVFDAGDIIGGKNLRQRNPFDVGNVLGTGPGKSQEQLKKERKQRESKYFGGFL